MLMHHADAQGVRVVGVVDFYNLSVLADHTAVWRIQAEEHAHQCGFPRAVLAEQRVDFSLFQLKGNMVVCADADEFLHDILHFNDIRQGHPSRIFFRQNASYFAGHAHGVPSGNGSLKPRRGEGAALPRRSSATSYGCAISPKTSCRRSPTEGLAAPLCEDYSIMVTATMLVAMSAAVAGWPLSSVGLVGMASQMPFSFEASLAYTAS